MEAIISQLEQLPESEKAIIDVQKEYKFQGISIIANRSGLLNFVRGASLW